MYLPHKKSQFCCKAVLEVSIAAMNEPERFRSPEYLNVLDPSPASQACQIEPSSIQCMQQWAESGYPNEICGLLIGTINTQGWLISKVVQIDNLNHARASDRFQLDPAGYQAVDKSLRGSGEEIIGVFHSHPDCPAKPSPTDMENAWEGFLYPIISVHQGKIHELRGWCVNDAGKQFQSVPMQSISVHLQSGSTSV